MLKDFFFSFLNEKFFTVGCTDHLLIKKKVLKKSTPIKSWVASNWAADCKMLINGVSVACKLLYQSASLPSEKWQMMFNNNSSLSGDEEMGWGGGADQGHLMRERDKNHH